MRSRETELQASLRPEQGLDPPLERIAESFEALAPQLAAIIPTRMPVDLPPTLLMVLERIAENLWRIAHALERPYGPAGFFGPDPPVGAPPPHLAFLGERNRKWVHENMPDDVRLRNALTNAMTDDPEGAPAAYRDLYDVYRQGRTVFLRQPGLGAGAARAMRELFYEWGVDGDGWWHR